ncbi:type III pantothenate kinase [Hufsiella ginkgonis]|uniref:Type III pantothenate kinase n=1 Tax=Hufsiella ginkgonis TaxID=2695274 RepID=A0A7K1XTU4_9SPHI|nr:type III pantothenate kinase [Hufsiella ginkgonis]MXV14441.1 type III pantothenate kinase [Hufsiella ginkgonis]
MNLVIDKGNSSAKIALFEERAMVRKEVYPTLSGEVIGRFLAGQHVEFSIISTVAGLAPETEDYLNGSGHFIRFHTGLKTKVVNRYATPETLGPDRLAAVIGAQALFPGRNVLVIDAGTAITYDLARADRRYDGGSISPGLSMRFRALQTFTGKLPLINADPGYDTGYGYDTRTAILSGVQDGIVYEAMGFIGAYRALYPDLQVVLCGGDVNFFETRMKSSIFAPIVKTEPSLVLIGLNEVIYQYND